MKDIKFRAWDGKQMLNRTLFDRNWYDCSDGFVKGAMPDDVVTLKVMQYTGLKDRNGIDIYESDIVNEGGLIGVIEFDQVRAAYCYSHPCGRAFMYSFAGEIIGNIYENQELLE